MAQQIVSNIFNLTENSPLVLQCWRFRTTDDNSMLLLEYEYLSNTYKTAQKFTSTAMTGDWSFQTDPMNDTLLLYRGTELVAKYQSLSAGDWILEGTGNTVFKILRGTDLVNRATALDPQIPCSNVTPTAYVVLNEPSYTEVGFTIADNLRIVCCLLDHYELLKNILKLCCNPNVYIKNSIDNLTYVINLLEQIKQIFINDAQQYPPPLQKTANTLELIACFYQTLLDKKSTFFLGDSNGTPITSNTLSDSYSYGIIQYTCSCKHLPSYLKGF